jgi:superfamily II DNA or RNA helicase
MARLEEVRKGVRLKGIVPGETVTVVSADWIGGDVLELTYKDEAGNVGNRILYRDEAARIEIVSEEVPWSLEGDGALFRLVSEAYRIRLAYLFDPLLAVHTSLVEPLPHQIIAVYEEMLPRQPLRFLLADDPGAGKTIMTGLYIKELLIRGDLRRCLIVCPGMLVEQWQDELWEKFRLPFEIATNDKIEAARTGNWFRENDMVLARLDKLSRDEMMHKLLADTDWDLVVCDEAHKMSASFYGQQIRYTKRYRLGQLLSTLTRHFLLLTATPHNGKGADFQLFLALLDGDRFEGKFRDGVHTVDTSDLMRRLCKEQLRKLDNTPLFPERFAYTVTYELSDYEAELYQQVTAYVREEFNRADRLENAKSRRTVGFALTTLQRRLASSPEAIYQSLRRRRERLEERLREAEKERKGLEARERRLRQLPELAEEDIDDIDDAPDAEREKTEDLVVDLATASRTVEELQAEIQRLRELERLAAEIRRLGVDRKWDELRKLLLETKEMFGPGGQRRKLIVFSEHRDTVNYLARRIGTLLGREEAVVTIHGAMGREDRRKAQETFAQDPDALILVATDAAGEGINLQRAHLMVNYDIPWNPNRLEQRFGRIHRIGQTEVCHVWNLVASGTREGDVFLRLLKKLEAMREALGGAVFDVLGKLFHGRELRELLMQAIRYGERPDVRERLIRQVDDAVNVDHLRELLEERALARDTMDASRVHRVREEMERAEARRLQPHFIRAFFLEAFRLLGGSIHEREPGRFQITHVPARIRRRDRQIGTREPVLQKYERVTFHKELISVPGKPLAEFLAPGHPLLDAVIDLILEQHRSLLRTGTLLVDESDTGDEPRVLVYLEHTICDARKTATGMQHVASRRLEFVEIDAADNVRNAGPAPYLDYRPASKDEAERVESRIRRDWVRAELEEKAKAYAVEHLARKHLEEVARQRKEHVEKTRREVKKRLSVEIQYWDHRAMELKQEEEAGRQPRMNWMKAKERADELQSRLKQRMQELDEEEKLFSRPPVVVGGAVVVPKKLLEEVTGQSGPVGDQEDKQEVAERARKAVMQVEKDLGFEPRDVEREKCGYDIESLDPQTGALRFIEVKGRTSGSDTVTLTRNEMLTALNRKGSYILALVRVDNGKTAVRYMPPPLDREPGFAVTSVNFDLDELWERAVEPERYRWEPSAAGISG